MKLNNLVIEKGRELIGCSLWWPSGYSTALWTKDLASLASHTLHRERKGLAWWTKVLATQAKIEKAFFGECL